MKKFSFIILIVSILVCAFALTVSAAETPEWTEITELEGMTDKDAFGADGKKGATSRVLMSDGNTYPAYYIVKNSTALTFDYTELNKKTGATYSKTSIVGLEIPNGIVTLARLQGYSSLVEIVVPEGVEVIVDNFLDSVVTATKISLPSTVKSIGYCAFYKVAAETVVIPQGCVSVGEKAFKFSQIKSITIPSSIENIGIETFYECKSLTDVVCGAATIDKRAFMNCTALENLTLENTVTIGEQSFYAIGAVESVVIPDSCVAIDSLAFKKSSVLSVTVPASVETMGAEIFRDCATLKSVYHRASKAGAHMYRDCSAIEALEIDGLVEAETYSFYGMSSLKAINLPETLETVGAYAFAKLTVEEIVTPVSLKNAGNSAFYSNSSLKRVIVLGSVIGDYMFSGCPSLNVVAITPRLSEFSSSNPFNGTPQNSYTVYFAGNNYEEVRSLTSSNIRFSGSLCAYEGFNREDYGTNNVFVYGVDICALFFDGHIENENPCVMSCVRCGVSSPKENPVHSELVTIEYANGYDNVGIKVVTCKNQGCEYCVSVEAVALFVYNGFSFPEFFDGGIASCYTVSNAAIEEYEKASGVVLDYGVFAVSKTRLQDNQIVDENGEFFSGAVCVPIERAMGAFIIKLTGFSTEEQKSALIAMGAYVIADENGNKTVSYMQSDEPSEGERYYFTTYNETKQN